MKVSAGKFEKVREDGRLEVPNNLTLKWVFTILQEGHRVAGNICHVCGHCGFLHYWNIYPGR